MFNDERTGTRQNDPLHNTKRNYIFFFLSLMNHFSRQNTNAIAYKITDFFFFKPHSRYCQQKFLKTMHIFVTPTDVFFFRRSSNDCSIAPRHSFSIFYAVLTIFFVFLLSLSSRIISISSSEALATICSASATTDAICKRSNVKRR